MISSQMFSHLCLHLIGSCFLKTRLLLIVDIKGVFEDGLLQDKQPWVTVKVPSWSPRSQSSDCGSAVWPWVIFYLPSASRSAAVHGNCEIGDEKLLANLDELYSFSNILQALNISRCSVWRDLLPENKSRTSLCWHWPIGCPQVLGSACRLVFRVAFSEFRGTISAILKSTNRKGFCRGKEGILLGKLLIQNTFV